METPWIIALTALAILLVIGIPLLYASVIEPRSFQVRTEKFVNNGATGRVLFLTDFHFGRWFGKAQRTAFFGVIDVVMRENPPDVVLFGGDFIDRQWKYRTQLTEVLAKLREYNVPMFGVTGNHDHDYGDIDQKALLKLLKQEGVRMLHNERVHINLKSGIFTLVGVDDIELNQSYVGSRFGLRPKHYRERASALTSYAKLVKDRLPKPIVLLSHNPDGVHLSGEPRPNLVLSGHTHGGQVVFMHLMRFPLYFLTPRGSFQTWSGRQTVDTSELIVSRGVGSSLFPLRILRRPEVVIVDFVQ